ncbi:carbohydrate ABC transporter permease [Paenibacillus sp. GCM10027626]|uniref:carbohydrate ABC transporter permease n=1 Tax=Paenibacillus sp. GCM10027626 TaxID=3273411 RepID=UPI00363CD2B6
MVNRSFYGTFARALNGALLLLLAASCVLPFFYALSVSLTPMTEVIKNNGFLLIPKKMTFFAYEQLLHGNTLLNAYKVSIFRTVVGTAINLLFTLMAALPLSRKTLPGRNACLLIIVFTMLFSGGIIPQYILIKELGLLNSLWVLIIPGLINGFYLLIMKSFFEQLPKELEEAAKMDGAGEVTTLVRIVIPLSMPIIATIMLFYAVLHWNSYFDAVMYLTDANKFPLQVYLRNILISAVAASGDAAADAADYVNPISIQMASVILTTLPILFVYPFIQKHFTRGVLLGSVKG